MRICKYNATTNELICGDEDGKVSFWSLKTLEPQCNLYIFISKVFLKLMLVRFVSSIGMKKIEC